MPELLKNVYSKLFLGAFTNTATEIYPHFNKEQFLTDILDEEWEGKELKQRMRQITIAFKNQLGDNYQQSVETIIGIIRQLKQKGTVQNSFPYLFFPDFIELYGLEDLPTSLRAMEHITQFISCEFAIRPFILRYEEAVMQQMSKWSAHQHEGVRRFSSEGCRPRLPWAMALPKFKKDPSPIIPILQNLKNDSSLFVRKSVANNINDIAKDNPDVVIQLAKEWKGQSAETDWIIRHGCRTLLKNAHKSAYQIFGLQDRPNCTIENFQISQSKIKLGGKLLFSFDLELLNSKEEKLRLEYAVYYLKANGTHTKKIFKLSEMVYAPNVLYSIKRSQRFENFTTRKHYGGKHQIAILVNGQELAKQEFELAV